MGWFSVNGGQEFISIGDKNLIRRGAGYGLVLGSKLKIMKDADRVMVQGNNITAALETSRVFTSRPINGKHDDGKVVGPLIRAPPTRRRNRRGSMTTSRTCRLSMIAWSGSRALRWPSMKARQSTRSTP